MLSPAPRAAPSPRGPAPAPEGSPVAPIPAPAAVTPALGGRGAAPPHLTSPQRNMTAVAAAVPSPHQPPLKPAASRPGSPPVRLPLGSSGAAMTRLPRLATPPPPRAAILRRERGKGAAASRRHLERGAAAMLGVAAGRCLPHSGVRGSLLAPPLVYRARP